MRWKIVSQYGRYPGKVLDGLHHNDKALESPTPPPHTAHFLSQKTLKLLVGLIAVEKNAAVHCSTGVTS